MSMSEDESRSRIQLRDSMVGRVRQGQPHTEHLTSTLHSLMNVGDTLRVRRGEIERDDRLSPTGRKAALADEVRRQMMADLAKAARPVRKALAHMASRRAALEDPIKVDPTDAVGELRRQELRTYLRSLPPGERVSAAAQIIRDDLGAAAILDAPPVLSGLPEDVHLGFRRDVAERVNGVALAEISGVEEDFAQGSAVAEMIMRDLSEASGLTPSAFAEEMAVHEAATE